MPRPANFVIAHSWSTFISSIIATIPTLVAVALIGFVILSPGKTDISVRDAIVYSLMDKAPPVVDDPKPDKPIFPVLPRPDPQPDPKPDPKPDRPRPILPRPIFPIRSLR